MPFVKKQTSKYVQAPKDVQKIFVGRASELHFFTEQILQPEDPAYNMISISGDGGVGKSTLLQRFLEETRTPEYREYCLSAIVDERQTTPASMMEKFAEQLHLLSDFKKALTRYKDALRHFQSEQETMQDAVLQRAPDFAGAAVEGVPIFGPLLREGIKLTTAQVLQGYRTSHTRQDLERLEDPVKDLTSAFISELNRLADAQVTLSTHMQRRQHRIILIFDTFEVLAEEVAPWLLDYFLTNEISSNIVLITAGRIPLARSLPDDPKRWLPYTDSHTIYDISLTSFSEAETRTYLEQRGITDPGRMNQIWQLSRGLPLYLSLLTSSSQYEVDPTADVVANFLRWLPQQEETRRRLVLDASLFSRPFNQDDLAVFSYINEQERPALYRWLIKQPFVRRMPLDGRYRYHELVEDLFCRHLYQLSPVACHGTRRALVQHYQHSLAQLEQGRGEQETNRPPQWLELMVAQAQQLFLVPDGNSHVKAIECLLEAYERTKQDEEIVRVLRMIGEDESVYNQAYDNARKAAVLLLQYLEAEPMSQEFVVAANHLLARIASVPSFSSYLLARIYGNRGVALRNLNDDQQAIVDFDRAIALEPKRFWYYANRGITYRAMRQYEQALKDFNMALSLNDTLDWVYAARGEVYRHQKMYDKALADFDRAIEIDAEYAQAYAGRGRVYRLLRQYEHSLADFDRAITLDPVPPWFYAQRGETCRVLRRYDQAIADYTQAITLDPDYFWAHGSRGLTSFMQNDYYSALADLDLALTLNPSYAWGYAMRGRVYRHLGDYQRALDDLNHAIALDDIWAYSQRGLVYSALHDYERAIEDFNQALASHFTQPCIYGRRGSAYLGLHDLERALADFEKNCQQYPDDLRICWMVEWVHMCLKPAGEETIGRLEAIAAKEPGHYIAYVCRGVAAGLRQHFQEALRELQAARTMYPRMWDAWFWYGRFSDRMAGQEDPTAIELALKLGMPPVLSHIKE